MQKVSFIELNQMRQHQKVKDQLWKEIRITKRSVKQFLSFYNTAAFFKNTYETPETDSLRKCFMWNKLPQGVDRVSEKINQVEQISLVRRHLVWENNSSGTSSTDRAKDSLWVFLCLDCLPSTQLSIETLRKTKTKRYTVAVARRLEAL